MRHLSEFGWHVSVISNSEQKFKSEVKKSQHNRPSVSRIGKKPYFDEWLPFGDNFHAVPSMVRNGIAKHAEQQVDAILACAAPVAACLAAGQLAHQIKVPVHHMQGDPWGPCDLRQPIRPFWTRLIEGAVEKRLSRRAASVIINTKTAKFAYLTAFPFLNPARVHVLHSPHDLKAITGKEGPTFQSPTLLYPGRFSYKVPLWPLFELGRALISKMGAAAPMIAVTDSPGLIPVDLKKLITVIGRYPNESMFALMKAADILLAILPKTIQRIPVKLSDYLNATSPVIVIEQVFQKELRSLMAQSNMGRVYPSSDIDGAANWVAELLHPGRHPVVLRNTNVVKEFSARNTAKRLAIILNKKGVA